MVAQRRIEQSLRVRIHGLTVGPELLGGSGHHRMTHGGSWEMKRRNSRGYPLECRRELTPRWVPGNKDSWPLASIGDHLSLIIHQPSDVFFFLIFRSR